MIIAKFQPNSLTFGSLLYINYLEVSDLYSERSRPDLKRH